MEKLIFLFLGIGSSDLKQSLDRAAHGVFTTLSAVALLWAIIALFAGAWVQLGVVVVLQVGLIMLFFWLIEKGSYRPSRRARPDNSTRNH